MTRRRRHGGGHQPLPTAPHRRFGRSALGPAVWLLVMLLAGEVAVRAAAVMLRRDRNLDAVRAGADAIYCIGDSFTYGQGVEEEQAWPSVLAGLLSEQGAPVSEVRTIAEPGWSSSVAMLAVAQALKAGDARLVLILSGWNANDGDFAAHAEGHRQAVPWTARADLWLSQSRLYRLAKQAATYRSRTLVLDDVKLIPQTTGMQLYDFRAYQEIARDNLRRIARMCHAAQVPCALLTYPHQQLLDNPSTRTEYYHMMFGGTPLAEEDYLVHDRRPGEIAIDAVIRWVSEIEGLPLIDLQPAFTAAKNGDLFLEDWHHPTLVGHRLIAETVFAAIR